MDSLEQNKGVAMFLGVSQSGVREQCVVLDVSFTALQYSGTSGFGFSVQNLFNVSTIGRFHCRGVLLLVCTVRLFQLCVSHYF